MTIEVGGVAGNYIAQFTENSNSLASSQPPFAIRLSGGQADERGNVTFHTGGRFQLTLGPVSGNQMTATFTDGKKITRYDMVRQGIYL